MRWYMNDIGRPNDPWDQRNLFADEMASNTMLDNQEKQKEMTNSIHHTKWIIHWASKVSIGWELVLLLPIQRQGNRLMRPCMGTVKINMLHDKTLSQCLPWCPRLWRSQPFRVSANLDVPQVLFCPWNKWPPSISMDHRSELLISKWGNQTFKEPNIAHG